MAGSSTKTDGLKPLQRIAASELGRGDTAQAVADRHHIGIRTVYRWLQNDTFRALVDQHQRETVGDSQRAFLTLRDLSLNVLSGVMREKPHSIAAMQAAKLVLVGCGICPEHGPTTEPTNDAEEREPVVLDPIGDVDPAQDEAQDIVDELTPEDAEPNVAAS